VLALKAKVDYSKLTFEFPLVLIYAAANSVVNRTFHESLLMLAHDPIGDLVPESKKLAKLYEKIYRVVGSHLTAMRRLAASVKSREVKEVLLAYVASSIIRGSSVELIHELARSFVKLFSEAVARRVKLVNEFVQVLITSSVLAFMFLLLVSSVAGTYSTVTLYVILQTSASAVLASLFNLRPVLMYLDPEAYVSRRWRLADVLHVASTASALALLVMGFVAAPLALSAMTALISAFALRRMLSSARSLDELSTSLRLVTEASMVGAAGTRAFVELVSDSLGRSRIASSMIYVYRTGRVPRLGENLHSLAVFLSRVLSLASRSGGEATKALMVSHFLVDKLKDEVKGLLGRLLSQISVIVAAYAVVGVAANYIEGIFHSPLWVPLQGGLVAPTFSMNAAPAVSGGLAYIFILVSGVVASYYASFSTLGTLSVNFAPPVLVLLRLALSAV
jgi:hypothetical protein